MIKLLIGGSPCTNWSIAQKNCRETKPEGLGWNLFLNYLYALEKYKPDYFLYENNKSMANPIKAQITKEFGAEPILINSALVSAQNRERYYWHNIPGVGQSEDKGIVLKDVLESSGYITPGNGKEKAHTLRASAGTKQGITNIIRHIENGGRFGYQGVLEPIRIGTIESDAKNPEHDSKQYRVYSAEGKSTTLCGQGGGVGAKTGLYACPLPIKIDEANYEIYEVRDGLITIKGIQYPIKLPDGFYIIRKLTVTECKRLQTVPDDYIMPCSATQNYKMLGNGWTVDVIAHILSHIPGIERETVEVLSMYDGMSCGHIALDRVGARVARYFATEIDKYAIQTTMANYPDTIQLGDAFDVRETQWK